MPELPENATEAEIDAHVTARMAEVFTSPEVTESEEASPAPQEVTPEPEAEQEAAPDPDAVPSAPAVEEDSFVPRADLESLLEGVEDESTRERIERAYKSFQGGYTRKTQELAAERAKLSGLDLEQAQQAVDFVTALQTDGDFALQVHEELTKSLETAGLTRRQAEVEATRQVEEVRLDPELEAMGVDPENPLVKKLSLLEQRLNAQDAEREQFLAQQEEQQRVNDAMVLIEKQTHDIRQADPKLSNEDMDVIYKIAASTGGNLFEAESYFKDQRDRIVSAYVNQKASVPAGVSSPVATPMAEEPVVIEDTDAGHKLAIEKLRQINASRD